MVKPLTDDLVNFCFIICKVRKLTCITHAYGLVSLYQRCNKVVHILFDIFLDIFHKFSSAD
jgi:hypothetical protein